MLCQVAPEHYSEQLAQKIERLKSLLPLKTQCRFDANTSELPQIETLVSALSSAQMGTQGIDLHIFASPAEHFRARVEFRVWHEGEQTHYVMFDSINKQRVNITRCPMALARINTLMPQLMHTIEHTPVLRHKLFQVDFLATLSGQMLVSLIYRTPIKGNQAWLDAAQHCRQTLPIDHIIGRARKQKVVLDQDFVTETLRVDQQQFIYQQIENSFTQPNPYMAQNMLHWTRRVAKNTLSKRGDLMELYCGNGHFSIALAAFYNRVLATEISKTSVASAQQNCVVNQVDNVKVVKMAAEEISQAMAGEREFFRLRDVNLSEYNFKTIFVDPPRAGLDALTREIASQFEHIIYVSCNPETLHTDLQTLLKTHQLMDAALFDQFPYTDHIESGVSLLKRATL